MSYLTNLDDITSLADGANDDGVCDASDGSDTVSGRDGDDAIDVKDGSGRDTVDCGGTVINPDNDTVYFDAGDTISSNCEQQNP